MRQKFTQKERDNETGLDYFGARYYASVQGRFTSPDPLLSSGTVFDPQSWNRYFYASNNPLKYTDPTGLYDWSNELGGSASDQDLLDKANSIQDEKKRKKAVSHANHIIGQDNQAFNSTHSGGLYDYGGPTDISEYETERRAYEVSSFVAQAVGKGSYPNNLEDRPKLQVWNSGWKAADQQTKRAAGIDRLINTYYGGASKTKPGLTLGQIKMNAP